MCAATAAAHGHAAVRLRGDVWEEIGRAQEPLIIIIIIRMICLMTSSAAPPVRDLGLASCFYLLFIQQQQVSVPHESQINLHEKPQEDSVIAAHYD